MRKRGPSGGGTLRRKSPQQGQRPSLPVGAVASARSHWPRASHCGLMHCTVKPGKYCMCSPSEAANPGKDRDPLDGRKPIRECTWRSLRKNRSGQGPRKIGPGQSKVMAGFWRERTVVSREKDTRYCGMVAETKSWLMTQGAVRRAELLQAGFARVIQVHRPLYGVVEGKRGADWVFASRAARWRGDAEYDQV